MRGGGSNFKQNIHDKGTKGLAWGSFLIGGIGGLAAAVSVIGDVISGVVGFFPSWVGALAFWIVAVSVAVDLLLDFEPNQVALYGVMALPTLARTAPGVWAQRFNEWCDDRLMWVNEQVGRGLGVTSAIGIAIVGIAVAYLMGRRVLAKSGGGR